MSLELIKYAFIAGEIPETFNGRADLEKYDLALSLARNWFVDYRGGLSTRPGLEFIDFTLGFDKDLHFVKFQFSDEIEDTYIILFGDGYIRFLQDGAYVLEAEKSVTALSIAAQAVFTSAGHGFLDGDLVKTSSFPGHYAANNRTMVVSGKTTNTFKLKDVWGNYLDTTGLSAYVSGGKVARVYTVTSTYLPADFFSLRTTQIRDRIRITGLGYAPTDLIRNDHTNWILTPVEIGASVTGPSGLSHTYSGSAGDWGYIYRITAVLQDGSETLPSAHYNVTATVNISADQGSITLSWNSVSGAKYYNIYRSMAIKCTGGTYTAKMSRGHQLGYVGRSYGGSFTDSNITPDFTVSPPNPRNPFVNKGIESVEVTAAGTGYTNASTISATDATGSGFSGYVVTSENGKLSAVVVESEGENYTNPSFTISTGTGGTVTATLTPAAGENPRFSSLFQQRLVYARTENDPLNVWGSRPNLFDDFSDSVVVVPDDSYEFELFSEKVTPITNLVPTRGGLLIGTNETIFLLTGSNNGTVKPTDAINDPHSYTGMSDLPVLRIDSDILYTEGRGNTVRLLTYNDTYKVYNGTDVSILSNHLFGRKKRIVAWDYAQEPFKLIHAVRSDGARLDFTLIKDQNIYAWTQIWTRGRIKDCIVMQENGEDQVYYIVERKIGGTLVKYIERAFRRSFTDVEETRCLDSGLETTSTQPAASLNFDSIEVGDATVTASASIFTADDEGKVIRGAGGKALIVNYVSGTEVEVSIERRFAEAVLPETASEPVPIESGDWTLSETVNSIGGLWHLEGETVTAVCDGKPVPDQLVTDGRITGIPFDFSMAYAGIPYICTARNLPLAFPQTPAVSRRKRVVGLGMRLYESLGLQVGPTLDDLRAPKERTDERWGEATRLQNGIRLLALDTEWDENSQTYFVQEEPFPCTILGFVLDLELGDDLD